MSALSLSRSLASSSVILSLVLVACGGSSVVVGKTDTTDQKLQTTKDGGATGNGTMCTWANTSVYDQYGKAAAVPTYAVGDEFKSIDGCNECTCTNKGIMCTIKTCEPKACDLSAMICPDGKTSVGRSGPNCAFEPCPGDVACTDDAKKCPDGSYVGRTSPSCEFAPCSGGAGTGCPAIAKQCPDGSYVGATGPNCEFVCPSDGFDCSVAETDAANKIRSVIQAHLDCQIDADCEIVPIAADCTDRCATAMAKTGEVDYKSAVDSVNQALCADYSKTGCHLIHPACAPSQPARCVDKKCQ